MQMRCSKQTYIFKNNNASFSTKSCIQSLPKFENVIDSYCKLHIGYFETKTSKFATTHNYTNTAMNNIIQIVHCQSLKSQLKVLFESPLKVLLLCCSMSQPYGIMKYQMRGLHRLKHMLPYTIIKKLRPQYSVFLLQ